MTSLCAGAVDAVAEALASGDGSLQMTPVNHRVWRLTTATRSVIVKVFAPADDRAFRRELAGADAARRALGSWVPALLGSGTVADGHHYAAYADIPGLDLNKAALGGIVTRDQALQLLGVILRRLHRSAGPASAISHPHRASAQELMATHSAHRAALLVIHDEPALAGILRDVARRLEQALRARRDAVLCHGDLHLNNVIGDRTAHGFEVRGVVDFESAVIAVPEFDLAKTIVVCSAYAPQAQRALVASYSHDVDPALLDELITYHTIDGWLWAVLTEGRDRHIWAPRLHAALKAVRVAPYSSGLRYGAAVLIPRCGTAHAERQTSHGEATPRPTYFAGQGSTPRLRCNSLPGHRRGQEQHMGTSSTGQAPAHPATPKFPSLYFTAIDRNGRLPLRAAAVALHWSPSPTIGLTVDGGLLRLSDVRGAFIVAEGTTATLDERWRITFPDDITAKTALLPGTRVILMTTIDRGLLVVPTTRLVRQDG